MVLIATRSRFASYVFRNAEAQLCSNRWRNRSTLASTPLTMEEVKENLSKLMNFTKGYCPVPSDRSYLLPLLPDHENELPPRSMKDSFVEVVLPLKSKLSLQDKYSTSRGVIRVGRLLEDLDSLAVWIALKHIDNPRQKDSAVTPYTIVTAGVDKLIFPTKIPKVLNDIKLSGQVIWSGKTSMEVSINVESMQNEQWEKVTEVSFIMAARNSTNTKGALVNRIIPSNPEEEELYKKAEIMKAKRKILRANSLKKEPPTPEEQQLIHESFIKTVDQKDPSANVRVLPQNSVWIPATRSTTLIRPHPENRNHHNTVFGGFLMRLATELSWACAFLHGQSKPRMCHISDMAFVLPISIDSFITMTSEVGYTEDNYMHVIVYCERLSAETQERTTTNVFHFTYQTKSEVQTVVPYTYSDSMTWLEGRRHFGLYKEAMRNL